MGVNGGVGVGVGEGVDRTVVEGDEGSRPAKASGALPDIGARRWARAGRLGC